jgi:uracil-DNA glycosylase family 4
VPPNDKPLKTEISECSNYFNSELEILKNLKVIVTLGKVAFDNCVKYYKQTYKIKKKFTFKHGKRYNLPDGIILIPSYHPSPRNVNTKLINQKMFNKLFSIAKKLSKI